MPFGSPWKAVVPSSRSLQPMKPCQFVELLLGEPERQRAQLACVLDGYEEFADFDYRELVLIEALRTLRMLHYAAWIAGRWDDPAFPRAFPWFGTQACGERHVLELREQQAALSEAFVVADD